MSERPNHRGPIVAGEPAADRLMRSLDYRLTHGPGAEGLDRRDVAVVLHALADHTALMAALDYAPGGMWPEARSLGRWLHDTADQLTDHPTPAPATTRAGTNEGDDRE